ncbi:MAG: trypsin-like serine protease [Scytolyngbya sp. HA4215-MV1]|nr:trypsin-like serine protease [Scytolyngbya sp. HA4215-MV1]
MQVTPKPLTIVSTGLLLTFLNSHGAIAQTANSKSLTVSSDTATQSYKSQQFNILPDSQLRSRMPVTSSITSAIAPANASTLINNSGAIPASDITSQLGSQIVSPLSFGTSQIPYTTSRVLGGTANPVQTSPYVRTGKLYMAFGGNTYNFVCSASMIGRSLLLTAAHCVHEYGRGSAGWARKVLFVPAKNNASEPYRSFESSQYIIATSYFNGTDTCTVAGVVCNNDLALVALNNNSLGQQAGNLVGWFGYGWNGYSFAVPAASFQSVFGNKLFAAITQLGYPGAFDSGLRMQLNTAYGAFLGSGNLKNTLLGSAMTGGSSGGPWLVNFGDNALGGTYGTASVRNVVVGVTSYGYVGGPQLQGSSWFGQNAQFPNSAYGTRGAGNIGKLVYDACDNPALPTWRLQSKGRCI